MNIPLGLIIYHILLVAVSFFTMLNRYKQSRWRPTIATALNLFVPVLIIYIGVIYGVLSAIISVVLYLMYMVIMNTLVFSYLRKKDKSSDLLEELKKKLGDTDSGKKK